MSITSADFRSQNNVYSSFKIVHSPGWILTTGNACDGIDPNSAVTIGAADGIDLNRDGRLNSIQEDHYWGKTDLKYTEPVLGFSYNFVKDAFQKQGNEVCVIDNNYTVMDFRLYLHGGKVDAFRENVRPLGSIASQLIPGAFGVIDFTTNEFLICMKK